MSLSPRRRSLWSDIPFTHSLQSCFHETQLKGIGDESLVKTPEKNCRVQNSKKKKNPFKVSRERKISAEMEDLSTKVQKAPFIGTTLAKQVAEILKISKH